MIGCSKNIKTFGLKLKICKIPVYDGRCMKAKIRTYGNKFYTNFRGLNLPRECVEYKSFAIISIDSVLAYEN